MATGEVADGQLGLDQPVETPPEDSPGRLALLDDLAYWSLVLGGWWWFVSVTVLALLRPDLEHEVFSYTTVGLGALAVPAVVIDRRAVLRAGGVVPSLWARVTFMPPGYVLWRAIYNPFITPRWWPVILMIGLWFVGMAIGIGAVEVILGHTHGETVVDGLE